MPPYMLILPALLSLITFSANAQSIPSDMITMGPRPYFLIDKMRDSPLKTRLAACANGPFRRTNFSIGHRGAQMMFPEHTVEANVAAARMGAGILECDVTFTKDLVLVCRHGQNDLHTTTNILETDLAQTCKRPFTPASAGNKANAECRTSEITLEEFRTLIPKMDASDKTATTLADYMNATADWRTDLYARSGTTLMTHADSIALFASLGAKFMPELKAPKVAMPFNGFSQQDYAQALIDDYKAAGIAPKDVWVQSFDLNDIRYWIENEPEFGAQAVYLDSSYRSRSWSPMDANTWTISMPDLKAMGVNYIAPPLWVLLTLEDGEIAPSTYAIAARSAGLNVITWTLERSGPLNGGGGWYYQSIGDAVRGDGAMFEVIDVLAQQVGIVGIFSDWPATVSYYASCMGLE